MKFRRSLVNLLAAAGLIGGGAWAQSPPSAPASMSLSQAQETALRNHPRIASATLAAQASGFAIKEARSAFYPTVSANATAVGAEHNSVLSAGAVTT
jgi:outer membrane protein TolC